MKIVSAESMRRIDSYTIQNEPIRSIDLMERAASVLSNYINQRFHKDKTIYIFAGPGNNGGDALVVSRLLFHKGWDIHCYLVTLPNQKISEDCKANFICLKEKKQLQLSCISSPEEFPTLSSSEIIIDGLFGSGLNRPLVGIYAYCVEQINASNAYVVSIDVPSGLFSENNCCNDSKSIIHAQLTLTLQLPKLAFMFPENYSYVGEWEILDIKLHPQAIDEAQTNNFYTTKEDCFNLLRKREKFAHKGNFGHALLIAGSWGKVGAAVLSAKACLRSGIGKLTMHSPNCAYTILQATVPEAMIEYESTDKYIGCFIETEKYTAIGIGPGLDTYPLTASVVEHLLLSSSKKMVIDADAINLIAANPTWIKEIPAGSILTPHLKEFDRLIGESTSHYERIEKAKLLASNQQIYIVLKGAHSVIVCPDGSCHFNSSGNAGMATAGSGDVLTGIILSLLAQGYSSEEAAILGVYVHGLAGDIASSEKGEISLIASDIIDHLGNAFISLSKRKGIK